MRWGIIGPGNIANAFAEDLKFVKEGEPVIVSVLSDKEESAREFADRFSISHFSNEFSGFLDKKLLDAVYIATPHTLHFEYAMECLKAGIPVLCEKPMGINAQQVRALAEASAVHKTFLMEGMWVRFLPSIQVLMDIITKGFAGNIISVKASLSYKAPSDPESRYFNPLLGGGSLLDLGIYPVFLALLLLGKPEGIEATGKLSDKGIDETCSMLFKYPGGQYASLESSIITQTETSAEIAGERGAIKILAPWAEKPESIELDIYNSRHISYPCKWEGRGFQFEVDEVYRCLSKNRRSSLDFNDRFSLDIAEVMDEVRQQLGVKYHVYE